MIVCVQLSGQLDNSSIVEIMVDIMSNTATCKFVSTLRVFELTCSKCVHLHPYHVQ